MLQILRRNNKKILAVLGVFLMIAFIVPQAYKRAGQGQFQSPGKINGTLIVADDYVRAYNDFQILTKVLVQQDPMDPRISYSIIEFLLGNRLVPVYQSQAFQIAMSRGLGMESVRDIARVLALREVHQMLRRWDSTDYLLLLQEAQAMGVSVDPQDAKTLVQQFPNATKDEAAAEIAVSHWLMILSAFDRLGQSARVSPAMATHDLSQSQQQAALDLVEFRADPLKASVSPPTAEQLQAFFEKYRETNPDTTPFGFGYRFPDRIQIEFLKIPHDAIAREITDPELYEAFKASPEAFEPPPAATQPTTQASSATQPTTSPVEAAATTRPTTAPLAAATTRPTTQSTGERFRKLDADSLKRVRTQVADQRVAVMAKAVARVLGTDWPTFRQAAREQGTTLPANPPMTSVGVAYTSPNYFAEVAKSVQLKNKEAHGVLASTFSVPQLLSAKQLALQPGIGTARLGGMNASGPEFAQYALQAAEPLLTDTQRKIAAENGFPTMALYQPSPVSPLLQDLEGNAYIFRITRVEPAHAPKSIEAVADQVKEDYLTFEGYQKAKAEAEKFLATAKAQGLAAAAKAADNRPIISTGLFNDDARRKVDKFQLPDAAYPQLIEGAFDLVRQRLSSGEGRPLGVIELPRAATVVVAQLADAKPSIQYPYFEENIAQYRARAESDRAAGMLMRWFDTEAIRQRMNYVPEETKTTTKKTHDPLNEPPPIM